MNPERQQSDELCPGFDTVTRLPNRTLFLSKIKEALDSRQDNKIYALLVLSLDNYAEIYSKSNRILNELMGAFAGRAQRVLCPDDYLAKIENHAFAVLMKDFKDLNDVDAKCKQILSEFERPFLVEESALTLDLSIGIAIASSKRNTPERLLIQASSMADSLQHQGRNLYGYCTLSPGTRLGSFELTSFLAHGGMGEVYSARDIRCARDAVIKVCATGSEKNSGSVKQFQKESQTASFISHKNLMGLIDTGCFHGRYFMVMEQFSGMNLREKLSRHHIFFDRVIYYALQIAEGLGAMHEKRIVHGDLKPENIFITDREIVKILDFGMAMLLPAGNPEYVDAETPDNGNNIPGTINYMSPEQVLGKPIDERSDIFSFGSVLYEMVCGKQAFQASDAVDVFNSILQEQPHLLYSAQVPALLNPVLAKCLKKNAAERFANAGELVLALRCSFGLKS